MKDGAAPAVPRRHHRLAPSRLHLAMLCGYSARADVDVVEVGDEAPAAMGRALHYVSEIDVSQDTAVSATDIAERYDVDPAELAGYVSALRPWWRAETAARPGIAWKAEVSYALDVAAWSVRYLPEDRAAWELLPTEIPGRTDLEGIEGDVGHVLDVKTGERPIEAKGNLQLLFGAACLNARTGIKRFRTGIVRINPDGASVDEATVGPLDIASVRHRLVQLARTVPTAEPSPGPHCRDLFCRLHGACPVTLDAAGVVLSLLQIDPSLVQAGGPVRSDEEAIALKDIIPRLEAWTKGRRAALLDYVMKRQDVSAGGTALRIEKRKRQKILVTARALGILRRWFPRQIDAALKRTTTKAALRGALAAEYGASVTNERLDEALTVLLQELARAGAVKQRTVQWVGAAPDDPEEDNFDDG